jgi:hypothetical protein
MAKCWTIIDFEIDLAVVYPLDRNFFVVLLSAEFVGGIVGGTSVAISPFEVIVGVIVEVIGEVTVNLAVDHDLDCEFRTRSIAYQIGLKSEIVLIHFDRFDFDLATGIETPFVSSPANLLRSVNWECHDRHWIETKVWAKEIEPKRTDRHELN